VAGRDEEELTTDERVRRGVGRSIANWLLTIGSLLVIGGWLATGFYELQPGEAGVLLFLGKKYQTVGEPGAHWHWPVPLEYLQKINVAEERRKEFGLLAVPPPPPTRPGEEEIEDEETPAAGQQTTSFENAIQTADSNIVNLGFVLKYNVGDAFSYLYSIAEPEQTLYDATQAAVREVVGQMSIDEVLTLKRAEIQREARAIVRQILVSYFAGTDGDAALEVKSIELQVVQAPAQVQQAFSDVVAAEQDQDRAISEARGDAKVILEQASAEAAELEQRALGYQKSKILEAGGEAQRFEALLVEYQRAPGVTRRRLYLETMEQVLPKVDKMLIEPGTVNTLPFLPLPTGRTGEVVR
jgi:membrane protease subunit HflK